MSTGGNVSKDRCAFVFRVRAVQEDWTVLLRTVKALRFLETSVAVASEMALILIWKFAVCLSLRNCRQKNLALETQSFRSTYIDVMTEFIQRRYSSCQHSIVLVLEICDVIWFITPLAFVWGQLIPSWFEMSLIGLWHRLAIMWIVCCNCVV